VGEEKLRLVRRPPRFWSSSAAKQTIDGVAEVKLDDLEFAIRRVRGIRPR
jgi:hypothetical protein